MVIGHCDAHILDEEEEDLAYYLPILDRGAYLEFDLISWNREWPGGMTDEERAQRLATLIRLGYSKKLLIGTDTCRLSQLHKYGGRGYDYIWTDFLPMLWTQGVDQSAIDDILVENPGRAVDIA